MACSVMLYYAVLRCTMLYHVTRLLHHAILCHIGLNWGCIALNTMKVCNTVSYVIFNPIYFILYHILERIRTKQKKVSCIMLYSTVLLWLYYGITL